jgi:cyclophilin family peptidyl-prolyl cis-trans isomerase
MGDWVFDELEPGEVYAEVRVRGFDGVMRFVLFEELAPVGVAAFIEAAEAGYYTNRTFHRVLEDIFIQGGAFNIDGSDIGISDSDRFDVETHENARNFFGALAFARDEHSGQNFRQFYIVTAGQSVDIDARIESLDVRIERLNENAERTEEEDAYLAELREMRKNLNDMPEEVRERYSEKGGYFLLDGTVTVFGQIIYGEALLREIAAVEVVAGNRADDTNPGFGDRETPGRPSRPADGVFIESIEIVRIPEPSGGEDDED